MAPQLAGACHLEPLFDAAAGFYLWHVGRSMEFVDENILRRRGYPPWLFRRRLSWSEMRLQAVSIPCSYKKRALGGAPVALASDYTRDVDLYKVTLLVPSGNSLSFRCLGLFLGCRGFFAFVRRDHHRLGPSA